MNYSNKTKIFVKKAKNIHGDTYNYSLVEYINVHTKIKIICPTHGEFIQTPNSHLSKKCGCPKCKSVNIGNMHRLSVDKFITRSHTAHNHKYNYSLVEYKNNQTKVKIICPKHGEFDQRPAQHMVGMGCNKCKNEHIFDWKKKDTNTFISQSIKIHNKKYSYNKTEYEKSNKKVIITCPIHGEFLQTPNKHLSGCGCKRCSKSGYSRKAIRWLKEISNKENIRIQHADNKGEFLIPGTKYKADGYCKETNTIYEFYGDKWHGNLKIYQPDEKCHPFNDTAAKDLYKYTMNREQTIRNLGFTLITIWESDYE
jgi:hypothetical protein